MRYTDKFRAAAVVMLEAEGYPGKDGALTRVSNHLGVPHSTLIRWFTAQSNPPASETVHETKVDMQTTLVALLENILADMNIARADADFRELATGYGILFDKLQLLNSKPTSIEHVELSDSERSARLAAIFNEARTRRNGQAPQRPH